MTTPHHTFNQQRLKLLSSKSGVYLMKDKSNEVIYIGKAKNLRARVRSYFNGSDKRARIHFILRDVVEIETIVTENEGQAIVLESDLVKKYQPRYNVSLKDDKAHLHVRIDRKKEWPRIELVRAVRSDDAQYLGPFPYSSDLRELLEVINKILPLRSCSDSVLNNRVRPCLEYQIKRCAAPCCLEVAREEYFSWLDTASEILQGKNKEVVKIFERQMQIASEDLRFEEAARLRDRIALLKKVSEEKPSVEFSIGAVDAFSFYREGSSVEVSVIKVRNGRLFEGQSFGFSEAHIDDDDLIASVLSQYYKLAEDIPENVVLPLLLKDSAIRATLLAERRGANVKILQPTRGDKARLLELASKNAEENFRARFLQVDKSQKVLAELCESLGLSEVPRVIDCVDVSHFQGDQTVASVVSFKDARADKSRYRLYKLKIQGKPDDFASIREVVMRHLSRCLEENTLCDLMLIDGGLAQLSQARAVRKELGLESPEMISIAKKRSAKGTPERIFVEDDSKEIVLNPSSDALHLLERLRDEAHRFAIGFHRKLRAKKFFSTN